MCGIAGYFGGGTRSQIEQMTAALAHRGPDDESIFESQSEPLFLGHRRLSIIDHQHGAQPMWDKDGNVGVIFNGEIYNHIELRNDLEKLGHRFLSSHSDTEVLIHGYKQWGEKLPQKLNGMFAFAIYDKLKRQLYLARDRFGEKPLFYAYRKNHFAFASELSALALAPGVGNSLNRMAIQKLFAYGYIPGPTALYEGTKKLPAGHSLLFDMQSGEMFLNQYWKFELNPDHSLENRHSAELADELEFLIHQAVSRRMVADMPIGIPLSGGIDSSSILAAATAGAPSGSINTFTIGFHQKSFDESAYARRVAEWLGSNHHEKILDLPEAQELIDTVLPRMDEPLGDSSLLPSFLLSRYLKENISVALSGDGADELFAGYDPFKALNMASTYEKIVPKFLHSGVRRLIDLIPYHDTNMSLEFKLKRALRGMSYPASIRLPVWMSPLEPEEIGELMQEQVHPEDLYSEAIQIWEETQNLDPVEQALTFFTRLYLTDNILVKSDRSAMMNGLESRAVFLDNDLVDFCQQLPSCFKFYNGESKILLKEVASRSLPSDIVQRKKKGFGIPLAQWLRMVPTHPPLKPILNMQTELIQEAFDEHRSGRKDHRLALWSWLCLQAIVNPTRM
ncbi:MAG: asparagine synthase (glutamine-hydrolyzing) [Rhizobiaceae bacterium]|nr:asparagine synthase (glutamine-hydrolyzing) [Rhizobiaceae bacterium]